MRTNDPCRCEAHKIIRDPIHKQVLRKQQAEEEKQSDTEEKESKDEEESDTLTSSNLFLQNLDRIRRRTSNGIGLSLTALADVAMDASSLHDDLSSHEKLDLGTWIRRI